MSSGSSSPFARAQLWSTDQWVSGSLTGTSRTPSPMSSSTDITTASLPIQRAPLYPLPFGHKATLPVTPSLLDSPLTRNVPSLAPRTIPDPFPRHSRYYLMDQMAVILVEGCLFRVHRYFLDRESQNFPKGTGSDAIPVALPGVSRKEFESLLDFLYDGAHHEHTPTLDAWIPLLSISTRFEMGRIRSRSIAEIFKFWDHIDAVDQVVMAVKYHVPEWLPLGYATLCQRPEPIEIEEAMKLGIETTVKLAKAREAVRSASNQAQSGKTPTLPYSFDADLVTSVIDDIFWSTSASPASEDVVFEAAHVVPSAPAPTTSLNAEITVSVPPQTPPTIPADLTPEGSLPGLAGPHDVQLSKPSPELHDGKVPDTETFESGEKSSTPAEYSEMRDMLEPSYLGSLNPLASTFAPTLASTPDLEGPSQTEEKERSGIKDIGLKKGKKWKGKKPSVAIASSSSAIPASTPQLWQLGAS